jgi:hypothetical protein
MPEEMTRQEVRRLVVDSLSGGNTKYPAATGRNMMENWVQQLLFRGRWATEYEQVDISEVPKGYSLGEKYVEVFGTKDRMRRVYWWRA